MIEFDKFVFKQAVTYCSDKLVEIPLKDQGAVYIGGLNGAGKSMPFNVFFNILFGYTPLSSKGKRKLIANENYYGRIDFKLNNIPFSIEQYFNNKEFAAKGLGRDGYNIIKNGESLGIAGGIPECEKFIASILPFTPDEFSGFYYLSQDSLHVLAYGKGSERLNYLSKVFGFDIYDKIRIEIKLKLDEVDVLLSNSLKAQEEVKKLREKLSKYPDQELLSKRITLFSYHLGVSKNERRTLTDKYQEINQNIKDLTNKHQLETSLEDYKDVRISKEIIDEIQNLRKNKNIFEQIIQKSRVEQKIHDKYSLVKKYINQDVEYLSNGLDKLIEKKGLATSLNISVVRRETLKSDIARYLKKLVYKPIELPNLNDENSKKLIEDRALLKKCNADLLIFTNLKGDGGKCSRCGHILEAKHIITEVSELNDKIKVLKLSIKECQSKSEEFNSQINILNKIKDYKNELKSITYNGDKIDILKLNIKITKVRSVLENAKESQRLKKEIEGFSKSKYTVEEAINKLSETTKKIDVLSDERDRSIQKEMIERQLVKIPVVNNAIDVLQNELNQIKNRLSVIEDAVLLITSDIREAEITKNIIKDYNLQLDDQIKLMDQIDTLHTQRRILNACWKSYAPGKMKKEAVAKISKLIAQKLNVFVPLIFQEDISFMTDPGENSVDILFKRGNQPPRDVRFLNGGHKKRFLIALIPTLAGLVSVKKRTNLIILDEIDANLDHMGKESIGEFLIPYLKEKFKTVIVISPSHFSGDNQLLAPIPLDYFDKIWIAEYKNGVSQLEKMKGKF